MSSQAPVIPAPDPKTFGMWSSEVLKERLPREVFTYQPADYDEVRVDTASYRLRVGPEIYVTPTSDDVSPQYKTRRILKEHQAVEIPSGQFAILCTEEIVMVPSDAMALIALRSKAKFKGLINVSGFHADPGYHGRLLFAVFNAGPGSVHVARGDDWFMISFIGLDRMSNGIRDQALENMHIPTDIISSLSGQFLSLKGLESKINETKRELIERLHVIEREHTITRWAAVLVLGGLIAFGVRYLVR